MFQGPLICPNQPLLRAVFSPARARRDALFTQASTFLILALSRVSQPGQSRLRPSNEHCFIVRVPGAKGCPGCETISSLPATHVIPLLNQTPHHRIGIRSIWLQRPIGAAH